MIANNKTEMLEELLTCDPTIAEMRNELNYTLHHCATSHNIQPCAEVLSRYAPQLKEVVYIKNETVIQRLNHTRNMRMMDDHVRNR